MALSTCFSRFGNLENLRKCVAACAAAALIAPVAPAQNTQTTQNVQNAQQQNAQTTQGGQRKFQMPPIPQVNPTAPPPAPLPNTPAEMKVTLDQAIQLAIEHNHALAAQRSTIDQSKAEETTANLRPNPTLDWDTQFLPIFSPSDFNATYFKDDAQYDIGISYLFERGKKRQHRLAAAQDATNVIRSQADDAQLVTTFNTATQFINALLAESTLDFAAQDLKSFSQTVDISEQRYKVGDMSEADLLKIKLQLLQFQTDVSAAKLARVQALAGLRQLMGFESVPENFDVIGDLAYDPIHKGLEDMESLALRTRPDLVAAQRGVVAAQSQETLAQANGKKDLDVTFDYTHVSGINTGTFFFNIDLPIFDRNQGEIARTRYAITQAQEQEHETSEQVISDVVTAFGNLRENDEIIQLYVSGYVDQAKQSRDISEYAYQRGAASLLDFLDAERSYRANQLAYRQSLASYMLAVEQLREAVGTRSLQ
jgi:outer membrane protein, heavy metal efflux system